MSFDHICDQGLVLVNNTTLNYEREPLDCRDNNAGWHKRFTQHGPIHLCRTKNGWALPPFQLSMCAALMRDIGLMSRGDIESDLQAIHDILTESTEFLETKGLRAWDDNEKEDR